MDGADHASRPSLGLGLALLLMSGCHSETPGPASSSETHFLKSCDQGCAAGLACICGVCTAACEQESTCTQLAPSARCQALPARCGGDLPAQICEVTCKRDAECNPLSAKHTCVSGVCRLASSGLDASAYPGSTDAPRPDAGAVSDDAASDAQSADDASDGQASVSDAERSDAGDDASRDASIPLLVGGPWRAGYRCNAQRPMSTLAPALAPTLLSGARGAYLARVTGTLQNQVELASLSFEGTLGTSTIVGNSQIGNPEPHGGIIDTNRSTLLWRQWGGQTPPGSQWIAQLDAAGVVTSAAHRATAGSDEEETYGHLVSVAQGYALAYVGGFRRLRLARLDANAGVVGEPVTLVDGAQTGFTLGDFVATSSGFMAVFNPEPVNTTLLLQAFDAQGRALAQPTPLETGSFGGDLLVHGNEVIATWVAGVGLRSSVVRLARFDLDGTRRGATYDLQYPIADQVNTFPQLLEMAGDIVMLWSQANSSGDCADRCTTSMIIRFVVLDGADLAMKSDVVELLAGSSSQLSPAQGAVQQLDTLVVSSTLNPGASEAQSGRIRCVVDDVPPR